MIHILIIYVLNSTTPPTSTLFPYTTLFRSLEDLRSLLFRRDHYAGARPRDAAVAAVGVDAEVQRRHARQVADALGHELVERKDRKSTRLNSSHVEISYAVFCLKKKKIKYHS